MGGRDLVHPEMDHGILVPGEADETDLSRLLRFEHRFHRSALGEDAVRVLHPDDFVDLHQVDVIRLQPQEAFVDLPGRGRLGATVDLGHEEDLLAVAVAQGLAHADLAGAVVVVPAVVHEGDAAVDGAADDPDALGFVLLSSDVMAAQADGRDLHPRASQGAIGHPLLRLGRRCR